MIALLILISSCATNPPRQEPVEIQIRPGEISYFKLNFPRASQGKLYCKNKVNAVFYQDGYHAFLSESYFSSPQTYQCNWREADKSTLVANVTVIHKEFPSERLMVDKKRIHLSKSDLRRVQRERAFKNKVFAKRLERPFFNEPFALPIESKVTSIYGSRRLFNNNKRTQHLGTDYRAKVGTPIVSSNAGVVVIARDMFFSGKMVAIDHGLGIFTLYGHLSKIIVKEGDPIAKGEVLGLSGKTGRVTGPHLHWGVIVNGLSVEGPSLVQASKNL